MVQCKGSIVRRGILILVGAVAVSTFSIGPTTCEGANLTVGASVAGMPPPGSAADINIPGFDPGLGALTGMDICVTGSCSITASISTGYWEPFSVGVPVSYSINAGGGASLGGFDAAGWSTLCGASLSREFHGSLLSFLQTRVEPISGDFGHCCAFDNSNVYLRFVSATPVHWYMQMDGINEMNWTVPAYPTATAGASLTFLTWDAGVEVTYHYTAIPYTAYTAAGTIVLSSPSAGVELAFDNVTAAGVTTLAPNQTGPAPPPDYAVLPAAGGPVPIPYPGLFTTAAFSGEVTVSLAYDPSQVAGNEADLRMFRYDSGVRGWVDVTTSVDTGANVVHARTASLSTFIMGMPAGSSGVPQAAPVTPSLSAASPNPFSGSTELAFIVPTAGPASVRVFDAAGHLVRTLASGTYEAGRHQLRWDGLDDRGRSVVTGVYFARLQAAGDEHVVRVARAR
jgi:hypothetical protein